MEDIYGFEGDGREISPGATADEILNGLKVNMKKQDLKKVQHLI